MIIWPLGVVTLAISPTLPVAVTSAFLGGLGFGALMPALMAHVVDVVRPDERGAAMATFMAAVDIGIALGSMMLGVVVQVSGFQTMFVVASGVAALGLVSFLVMSRPAVSDHQLTRRRT
jgi:MFS family permease